MCAVLLDNADIAPESVIAAGAVVLANAKLEPGLYAGVPAKKLKDYSPAVSAIATRNARQYMMYKEWYK